MAGGLGARSGSDPEIYQTYVEKMGRFVNSLLDRGYRVRLLTGETVDARAVRDIGQIAKASRYELTEGLPPQKARQPFTEPINSLHDVLRQIGDTDVVVATRFHNVVCALKLARPTISIGYEAKNDSVMTELGLGQFCQSIEELDLKQLETQLAELLKNKEQYEAIIRRNLDAVQLRVKRHEQELLSELL
jgi:polysaccharide pyruvyl transferase WcaK-like protein